MLAKGPTCQIQHHKRRELSTLQSTVRGHYSLPPELPGPCNARTVLMQSVSHLIDIRRSSKPVILSKLLHGCSSYTSFENITILTALHTFIDESRRFTATHIKLYLICILKIYVHKSKMNI